MNEKQAAYVAKAPISVQGTLKKAFEGTASPRGAIKAACLTCVNYDREEIRSCGVVLCPLWKYRPFQ